MDEHYEHYNTSNIDYLKNKCKQYTHNIFNNKDTHYDKIYSIGDIHGDYDALITILSHIKCITINNNKINWNKTATNICIIQVGDIIDGYRPDIDVDNYKSNDFKAITLLLDLDDQARKYNSRIILLYGNHEVFNMFNIMNDIKLNNYKYSVKQLVTKEISNYISKLKKIKYRILCNYYTVVIINGYIFCHAGIVVHLIKKFLKLFKISFDDFKNMDINDKIKLINTLSVLLLNYVSNIKNDDELTDNLKKIKRVFLSLFNHRYYSGIASNNTENNELLNTVIHETKKYFNLSNMIIGHNAIISKTPKTYNNITLIDTLISRGFNVKPNTITFICIKNNKIKNITINRH